MNEGPSMETIIEAKCLTKKFRTKHKAAGLLGSMKSVIRPEMKEHIAVDNISFSVQRGEVVGFLGPNGAGKSTTIKMLIGILFPDGGEVSVLGMKPWKQRQQLAFKLGAVFGQKPQLWYHLPAIDTFNLMSKIYEIEPGRYRRRLDYLVDLFDIDYLDVPVRRLSLGQRMRAEVVASLLHEPEILLLDEPTIGLDIIAKQKMRDLIKRLNKDEKVTVFLTSHDMDDVEKLCKRIMVINDGKIVFNGTIDSLRNGYLLSKEIDVKFSSAPKRFSFPGAKVTKRGSYSLSIQLQQGKGKISELIDYLTDNFDVLDVNISDPSVEDIVAKIYRGR